MRTPDKSAAASLLDNWPDTDRDFSLVLGGPLYQLYLRTKLSTTPLGLLPRRVIAISAICWVPLLILSAVAGQTLGRVAVPFLLDIEVHVRFLAVVPLLLIAEPIVHQRIFIVVRQFLARNIISSRDRIQFAHIIASTTRLRNSVLFEAILLVLCFSLGHWIWKEQLALGVNTWYAVKSGGTTFLSKAGYWYAFVSLPIFRFLLFRWYFRLFLWYQFLWRVRALALQLNLYHPDCAGGLGFLAGSVPAFAPVLVAQTMLLSGFMGDRIWHTGANLLDFKMEIVGSVLFLMLIVLVPLTFFIFHLEYAGRIAKSEFGTLSSKYVEAFREKWVQHASGETNELLGTPDIQSLADLGHSFETVNEIRLLPFGKETVTRLGGLLLLPLLPLTLTVVPLKQIVEWMIKLLF